MRENVGTADAILRSVVGAAVLYAAVRELGLRQVRPAALMTLGALLVESAMTRVCPVNYLLGLDTRGFRPWQRKPLPLLTRGVDARPPTLAHVDWGAEAADLDLPYDDFASFQRPPADS
jgi:hypothetical protein